MRTYSSHYIPWHWLYVLYKLLCICPAGGGNSVLPTDFFCNLQSFKHCTGSLVCHRTAFRCRRCGKCHGNCPGGIRHRYYDFCTLEKPTAVSVKRTAYFQKSTLSEVPLCIFTCLQQSVMNFGILMIQGLVNSFGTAIMGCLCRCGKNRHTGLYAGTGIRQCIFAVYLTKIMVVQNTRIGIRVGIHTAVQVSITFCIVISAIIWIFARPLMQIFVDTDETSIIAEGVHYSHIEAHFTGESAVCFAVWSFIVPLNALLCHWCSPSCH